MNCRKLMFGIGGGIGAALFVLAFIAAPKSCEWGLPIYFWAGIAALIVLLALPFVMCASDSIWKRLGFGLGLAAFGFGVWVAGFAAADVRIICRLF